MQLKLVLFISLIFGSVYVMLKIIILLWRKRLSLVMLLLNVN